MWYWRCGLAQPNRGRAGRLLSSFVRFAHTSCLWRRFREELRYYLQLLHASTTRWRRKKTVLANPWHCVRKVLSTRSDVGHAIKHLPFGSADGHGMTKEINSGADWETQRERLNAEIHRLEAALVEAKEVTPGPGRDEAPGESAVQLREVERDLEEASERWREERRRLNAEVDRLEEALQKARAEGRTADVVEAAGAARIQDIEARAKEQIQTAAEGWHTERSTLASRLEELHRTVAGSESKVAEVEAMREELLSRLTAAERKRADLEEERNANKVAHAQE